MHDLAVKELNAQRSTWRKRLRRLRRVYSGISQEACRVGGIEALGARRAAEERYHRAHRRWWRADDAPVHIALAIRLCARR